MAAVPNAEADEPSFSIDLNDTFKLNEVEMKELDTEYVQDSDLNDLMDSVKEGYK